MNPSATTATVGTFTPVAKSARPLPPSYNEDKGHVLIKFNRAYDRPGLRGRINATLTDSDGKPFYIRTTRVVTGAKVVIKDGKKTVVPGSVRWSNDESKADFNAAVAVSQALQNQGYFDSDPLDEVEVLDEDGTPMTALDPEGEEYTVTQPHWEVCENPDPIASTGTSSKDLGL